MVCLGRVVGRQSYSFKDDRTGKLIEGMVFYVSRADRPVGFEGLLVDRLSLGMRDLPLNSIPVVGDVVQYATYYSEGKLKAGYLIPSSASIPCDV